MYSEMLILPLRPLTHGVYKAQSHTAQAAMAKTLLTSLLSFSSCSWRSFGSHVAWGWCHAICFPTAHLSCYSGGSFRFESNSSIWSLIYAFLKHSIALVHEISALTGCFLHFPESWLVFMGLQRATDTSNLIKAVRMLMVSAFLILR